MPRSSIESQDLLLFFPILISPYRFAIYQPGLMGNMTVWDTLVATLQKTLAKAAGVRPDRVTIFSWCDFFFSIYRFRHAT